MSLKGHAALIALVVSAALTAGRLLAISRFDVNTAATILQVSGTTTAVAGTALTLLPFALVVVVSFLGVAVFIDKRLLDWPSSATEIALWVSLGATFCLAAPAIFIFTAALLFVCALIGRYLRQRGEKTRVLDAIQASRLLKAQATLLLAVLLMAPIIAQRPWLPEETVVGQNGDRWVGYVLGEVDDRLAIMKASDRTVIFVDDEDVSARYLCLAGSGSDEGSVLAGGHQIRLGGSFIGSWIWGNNTPQYPNCPRPTA